MSDLIVIVYPTEDKAEAIRQKLANLQKEYLIELSDAVIAVKQDNGRIKLIQLMNTTAVGAISGGFWGLLIGSIFLMPLLGASIGAASGALGGALTDYGINDGFMRELATNLKPENAALFLLIRKMTADKFSTNSRAPVEPSLEHRWITRRNRRCATRWRHPPALGGRRPPRLLRTTDADLFQPSNHRCRRWPK